MYCPGLKQNIPELEWTSTRPARPMTREEIAALLRCDPDPEEWLPRIDQIGKSMARAVALIKSTEKLLAAHEELKEARKRRRRALLHCVGIVAVWIVAALVVLWLLA